MVYKTLHSYILRELLRIFLLTALALTTLLAFGGLFKPLTKQGIDIGQLMVIMLNLMPAMLAYAIPTAALFAAVLVYWRMSTDNELTACRAGGISFVAVVMPAFILGLVVASIDLVFVNYVFPRFLQSTERAIMRDAASLIVSAVGRQEKIQVGKIVVYADSAEFGESDDPNTQVVILHGMAASFIDKDKPARTVVARQANLSISNSPSQDLVEITGSLDDSAAFDPSAMFRKFTGPVPYITPDGRPFPFPSQLKSKPKFLNWRQLIKLNLDPSSFPRVAEVIDRIADAYTFQEISRRLRDEATKKPGVVAITFDQAGPGTAQGPQFRLTAGAAVIDEKAPPDQCLTFFGGPGNPIRIEQWSGKNRIQTWSCDSVVVALANDKFTGTGVGASLQLIGNVKRRDEIRNIPSEGGQPSLTGIVLPPRVKEVNLPSPTELDKLAESSPSEQMRNLSADARVQVQKLYDNIKSELHSRGSFSLSCLTLVLFGAALGILLKGKNPLAVFVLGFVPAIFLVLLITAGRQLAEGNHKNVSSGIVLIWAGNVVLLALVAAVYAKLLRR